LKIAIFGLGYVGLTSAACLIRDGHEVVGFDVSDVKVKSINAGKCPIHEPGLGELIRFGVEQGRLRAVAKCTEDDLNGCVVAFVCVGTPSAQNGSHDMQYIKDVSAQVANACKNRRDKLVVAYRSTMRPGSIDGIVAPIFEQFCGAAWAAAVELVYHPEFLRESTALFDYYSPPKIVYGTSDGTPCSTLSKIYAEIDAPVFSLRYREAEIIKFVDNSFHALKVAFANEVGRICCDLGISPHRVHEIFVSDTKLNISSYYLRPGAAFGGSCLPKDVRALQYIGRDLGLSIPVLGAIIESNEGHKAFIRKEATRGLAQGASILLVGLSFKVNSDDLRESPQVDLAEWMTGKGFHVRIFDPDVDPRALLGKNMQYSASHLPHLGEMMIDRSEIGELKFDRVVLAKRGYEALTDFGTSSYSIEQLC